MRKVKFAKQDLIRFRAMIAAYEGTDEDKEVTHIVLLKEDGTICRRNTLKSLHEDDVVVMRCSASPSSSDTASDSSDSDSSDSE